MANPARFLLSFLVVSNSQHIDLVNFFMAANNPEKLKTVDEYSYYHLDNKA